MQSFLFALNAVAPIILMVAIGFFLKRSGLMNDNFVKLGNKLGFHLFLPVMLFMNVYKIDDFESFDPGYIIYAMIALVVIFLAAIPGVIFASKIPARRGVLLQAAFRSNYALIGIPLATSLFNEEGAAVATLLSAILIPAFNILAVISMSIFGTDGKKASIKSIVLGVIKNPLIQGIAAGVVVLLIRSLFLSNGISFRLSDVDFVYKVLDYLSAIATPLALLILGAQFEFSSIGSMRREIIFGTVLRNLIVPLVGIGAAYIFFRDIFGGAHFAALVAMFGTPVAVSSVAMSQEMGGDTELAGQLVVWTTLFSAVSVFLASLLLRIAGIFG